MNCLKQDFDDVFRVFLDVLRNPAFAQDKLDLAKVQSNSSIARRNDSVGGITGREIGRLVYGPDSPLVSLEEYATIAAITREDLVAWHKTHYVPNNIMLGVSGDFDSKAMRKTIERAFGYPVDLEWAIDTHQLWALQARPITGVQSSSQLTDDDCEWSRANFKETMPELPSPVGNSFLELFIDQHISILSGTNTMV